MARLALSVTGAAVGGFFGGPTGAAIGWNVGSAIGAAAFPDTFQATGPRLDELRVQSSSYGKAVPLVYGSSRIGGNMIWTSGLKERKKKEDSGGKGGGSKTETTTYTYSSSFAIVVCHGPIVGFARIWADGNLIYDNRTNAYSGSSQTANTNLPVTFYYGTTTQLPDPTMESHEGVGNVPAYTGRAYVVFDDLQLGDYGNRIPNLTFEVVAAGTETTSLFVSETPHGNNNNGWAFTGLYDGVLRLTHVYENGTRTKLFDVNGNYLGETTRDPQLDRFQDDWSYFSTYSCGYLSEVKLYHTGAELAFETSTAGGNPDLVIAWEPDPSAPDQSIGLVALNPTNDRVFWQTGDGWYLGRRSNFTILVEQSGQIDPAADNAKCPNRYVNPLYVREVCTMEEDLRHVWQSFNRSSTVTVYLYEIGDDSVFRQVDSWVGTTTQNGGSVWAEGGMCYVDTGTGGSLVVLSRNGNTITSVSENVGDIANDLMQRSGLAAEDIDTSAVSTTVQGFVVDGIKSARDSLEELQRIGLFDVVETDNKLKCVPRSGAPALTIPQDDLAAYSSSGRPANLTIERAQESELPRTVDLTYLSFETDYQAGAQRAQRQVTTTKTTEVVKLPAMLTDQQAAQLAEILLQSAWTGRVGYAAQLSTKYAALDPADVVQIDTDKASHICQLQRIQYGAERVLAISGRQDAAAAYVSDAPGVELPDNGQEILPKSPTTGAYLDIPLLARSHDETGFYIGASGYSDEWSAGNIYRSSDQSAWALIDTINNEADYGFVINALAEDTCTTWRRDQTLSVRMVRGTLESKTELEVLNGANAAVIGAHGRWEVIQWRDATLEPDGTYTLSHLLRGRLGTEHKTAAHVADDGFVVLDNSLLRAYQNAASLNIQFWYKAVSIGGFIETAPAVAFTNTGESDRPYSPHRLRSWWTSGDDLEVRWIRRSRFPGPLLWNTELGEESEQYRLEFLDGETVKRSVDLTSRSYLYRRADLIADGFTAHSAIDMRCYQMSARVGIGAPALHTSTPTPGVD